MSRPPHPSIGRSKGRTGPRESKVTQHKGIPQFPSCTRGKDATRVFTLLAGFIHTSVSRVQTRASICATPYSENRHMNI